MKCLYSLAEGCAYIYKGFISAISGAFDYRGLEPTFLDKRKYIPSSSGLQFWVCPNSSNLEVFSKLVGVGKDEVSVIGAEETWMYEREQRPVCKEANPTSEVWWNLLGFLAGKMFRVRKWGIWILANKFKPVKISIKYF